MPRYKSRTATTRHRVHTAIDKFMTYIRQHFSSQVVVLVQGFKQCLNHPDTIA